MLRRAAAVSVAVRAILTARNLHAEFSVIVSPYTTFSLSEVLALG